MALELVLFDVGGTLIDYPVQLEDAGGLFERYREDLGLSSELVKDWIGFYLADRKEGFQTMKEATFLSALKKAAAKNGLDMREWEMLSILAFLYKKVFGSTASLIEGSKEILSDIRGRKLPIGLISNTAWPGKFHEEDLKRFGILDFFDLKIWTSAEGIRKPHKALFLRPLGHFSVDQRNTVYIGDTFGRDVVGPNSIGIKSIWVSNKVTPQPFDGWKVKDLSAARELLSKI